MTPTRSAPGRRRAARGRLRHHLPAPVVRRVGGADDGVSLILALVFLIVVGLIATVLLAMSFTGLRATHAYRLQRVLRYNSESAINLAVQMLTANPLRGTNTDPEDFCFHYALREDTSNGTRSVFVAGSTLNVVCGATPGSQSGGVDHDGGQAPRDVTIAVRCFRIDTAAGRLNCGGGTLQVVASARVRFDVNADKTQQPDETQRAVIPKIVSWDTDP